MRYKHYEVYLKFGRYTDNDNTAIQMFEKETNYPVAVCTINIDKLPDNQVAIKDYSENEGMLEWLQTNGIVGSVINILPSGFITAPVVEILIPFEYES